MKIIAEFNSNEELLSFVSTFSGLGVTVNNIEAPKVKKATKREEKVQASKEEKVEAEIVKDEEIKNIANDDKTTEVVDVEPKEEGTKAITKEDVLNASKVKMAEGKTAEVKAIIAAHGAKNLSGIKEEDYEEVMKELEVL